MTLTLNKGPCADSNLPRGLLQRCSGVVRVFSIGLYIAKRSCRNLNSACIPNREPMKKPAGDPLRYCGKPYGALDSWISLGEQKNDRSEEHGHESKPRMAKAVGVSRPELSIRSGLNSDSYGLHRLPVPLAPGRLITWLLRASTSLFSHRCLVSCLLDPAKEHPEHLASTGELRDIGGT